MVERRTSNERADLGRQAPMDGQDAKHQDLQRNREYPDGEMLTTGQGVGLADNQNSLKAGTRGPTLLEDFILREKITSFDHERIPERVVHARGSAAHGVFELYEPMSEFTAAGFLQDPSVKTPVFVRFSTVAGSRGSLDTARDVRGFAVKFYTQEGVFDIVGNNIPVFFIQDAIKFPDVIHAVKPEPHNEIPQAQSAHDTFWDFIWLTPESTHMVMWVMSDRAIPRSFRMMEGFGVNSYRFVNAQGKAHLVKFHWKPLLGVHSLVWNESLKLGGYDPDFHRRDLWDAIDSGAYPEWEFGVQLIPEEDQLKYDFDPLDPTKIVPEEVIPVRRIGKLTLNRNPDNFFAETEQVAFDVGNLVPGIDFSNDPLLQGRAFSYVDTQLTRLGGPNFHEIPINRSVAPVHTNQRDGFHRHTINTGRTSYQPNSLGGGCPFQAGKMPAGFESYAERIDGQKIRERSESFRDHFSQATLFWNSQSAAEKDHIVLAFRFELGKVTTMHVRERMVDLLTNVDLELAKRVAAGIGVTVDATPSGKSAALKRLQEGWETFGVTSVPGKPRKSSLERSTALSMENTVKDTIKTRKIAILAANGVDATQLNGMKSALTKAGAVTELVSPLALVKASDGSELKVDKTLLTCGSVLYDAIFVPGGKESAATLAADGDAVHFVDEAFKHCKAIAATGEGVDVLLASHIAPPSTNGTGPDQTLQALGSVIAERKVDKINLIARRFVEAIAKHRDWSRQSATGAAAGMVPVPA
jgi:catalase